MKASSSVPARSFAQQVTFLYTRDLLATASFYEDLLGLPLILDQGACRIYRVAQGAFLGFCQRADAPAPTAGIIVTLVTEAVDGWYAHLVAQGVVFEKPPTLNPTYNIYHCFLPRPERVSAGDSALRGSGLAA